MTKHKFKLEDIREFLIRRTGLAGSEDHCIVTDQEYQAIKERTAVFTRRRVEHLRAYIAGWLAGRPQRF